MKRAALTFFAAVSLLAATSSPARGAMYYEVGDAGQLVGTAQDVAIVGNVEAIIGRIENAFDADLFRVLIDDPWSFSARVVVSESQAVNPQLFLFDEWGHGLVANDDGVDTPLPNLPMGSLTGAPAGMYLLGISAADCDPRGLFGDIFPNVAIGVMRPDGLAAFYTLEDWRRDFRATGGDYAIALTGIVGTSAPLPGDYSGNGVVDAADYTVWRDTLGSTTDLRANGDDTGVSAGIIDQADYLAWKANFGMSADSGAATSQNVPEPTIVVLGLFGAAYILVCQTRRANPRVGLLKIAGPSAVLLLGLVHSQVLADTFGNGVSSFEIDFVTVGDPGNPDDSGTTGNWYSPFGGVGYAFRIGAYEVSRDMIAKANAEADLAITMYSYAALGISGGDRATRPASGVTWNEAARFVNWLNLSSGYPLAYKFVLQPGDTGYAPSANIELWQPGDAGYDADNPYRNSGAHYFLPSEDEWYKAAYYSGSGSTYFDYATQQDYPSAPAGVPGGLTSDTAVFQQNYFTGPADIDYAGGLSHYATMGQNGNVWEWIESASDGSNNIPGEPRTIRGAHWSHSVEYLRSNARLIGAGPTWRDEDWGFRVASVEEPQCLCPSIETQPQSQTVAVGSDTTFFVDVSGSEPLSYQWQKDGMEMPGAIDSSLSIHDAQFGDAGNYRVMSVNPCGFALSDIASLTIVPAPLAGDYNGDSIVDAADYTIWRDTLGSLNDLRANGDNTGASAGLIDQADFDVWRSHFGLTAGSATATAAVPEPATIFAVTLAVVVGLVTRPIVVARRSHANQSRPQVQRWKGGRPCVQCESSLGLPRC